MDVVQAVAARLHLGGVFFIQIAVLFVVRMAVEGIVVEVYFRIQSDDLVIGRQDEGIDFYHGAVIGNA